MPIWDTALAASKKVKELAIGGGLSDDEADGERRQGRARRRSSLKVPKTRRSSSIEKPKERRSSSLSKPKRRSSSIARLSTATSPTRPKTKRSLNTRSEHRSPPRTIQANNNRWESSDTVSTTSSANSFSNGNGSQDSFDIHHRSSSQSIDKSMNEGDLSNDYYRAGNQSNIVMADEDLEEFAIRMTSLSFSDQPQDNKLFIFKRKVDHSNKVLSTTIPFNDNDDKYTMESLVKRIQEGASGKHFLTFTKTEARAIASGVKQIIFCLPQIKMRPQFDKDAFGAMKVNDVLAMTRERPLLVELKLEEISQRGEQLNIF